MLKVFIIECDVLEKSPLLPVSEPGNALLRRVFANGGSMADTVVPSLVFGGVLGKIVISTVAASIVFIVFYLLSRQRRPDSVNSDDDCVSEKPAAKSSTQKKSKRAGNEKQAKRDQKVPYSHRWLLTTLKGHSGNVLNFDFSSNGKYLASCADDRAVLLWQAKTFTSKEIKSTRANIEFDYANQVKWSPDCKAFVISQAAGNAIQVYKIPRKEDNSFGKAQLFLAFPQMHKSDIIDIGMACNGKFIMSCSGDTTMIVWDLKGDVLATIDTHHITNYSAAVSPCGRFVSSSGFTPDVKIWEVVFAKTGEFKEVKRAFELKGHSSGVVSFAFNSNSTRMASLSKDGSWKLWDTDIDYQRGQEPYLLNTGAFPFSTGCFLNLSPDGRTIAIASGHDVSIFSGLTAEEQEHMKDIHDERITALGFSPTGKYLLVSAGKHIRLFHNVLGFENAIADLEKKKVAANNNTMRTRLQIQLDDIKSGLNEVLKGIYK